MQPNIIDLFRRAVADGGDGSAVLVCRGREYESLSWRQFASDVASLARWLEQQGVEAGDRVIQVAENRYEWLVADVALQWIAAVHVPVHASLAGPQVAYQIQHSGARLVLISTAEQVAKLARCADRLDDGLRFFSYEPCQDHVGAAPVAELPGLLQPVDDLDRWLAEPVRVTPESLATILYTSGTTGQPKGVMLTQSNLVSNVLAMLETVQYEPGDLRLTFLPLSHIFARACDLYTWIASGTTLALARSRESVVEDCRTLSPTLINGVPYFFDKVYRALVGMGADQQSGALRSLLGGRVRLCCSGGAALADHVYDFFQQQQVPLLQGYGLTETSPVISMSSRDGRRRGAAGKPISGVEVRIAADGEILTRGPHVMRGYYNDPAATNEILRDGWLYTGDFGRIDEDGYLYILGRKKEILVTTGGKNIAPVLIETLLAEDPLIQQAMVVGDQRNYLAALIVPDLNALRQELSQQQIELERVEDTLDDPRVIQLFQQRVEQRLSDLSAYEQVRKITLLRREFSLDREEVTPKLSLRRAVIARHFAREIEAMYGEPLD